LQNCLRLDLDEHLRRDEPFYLHHDAGGPYLSKDFSVRAPDLFPVVDIGEVHPCLDDILQGSTGAFESRLDVAQYLNGLRVGIADPDDLALFVCSSRSGNVYNITNTNSAGISDDGFPLAAGGYIVSRHNHSFMETKKL